MAVFSEEQYEGEEQGRDGPPGMHARPHATYPGLPPGSRPTFAGFSASEESSRISRPFRRPGN